jgi:hypothetical protein
MVYRCPQRASRPATTGCAGPARSLMALRRPAIAIGKASAGPATSGPEPWVQSRSVGVRRRPRPGSGSSPGPTIPGFNQGSVPFDRTGEIQLQPMGGGWHGVGTGSDTTSHLVTERVHGAAANSWIPERRSACRWTASTRLTDPSSIFARPAPARPRNPYVVVQRRRGD